MPRTKTTRSSVKKTIKNAVPEALVPVQSDALPAPDASASVEASPAPDGDNNETQIPAAVVALNLCMVSLSQIVDYNDINILKMEYEAILNNLNLEYFPKDETLFEALKAILDTCQFFMLQEKDKELLKKKQALKLKAGLSNINFFGVISTGNPYVAAASLAMMIGVAAVNYKTQKARAEYENEAEEWALEKSALEQLHRLRGALFATAWRLADTYGYKDEWRLSEKQIRLYDEILADPDPYSRFWRLETIQDKFKAYPLFFYYLAHSAIESVEERSPNNNYQEKQDFKRSMYKKAKAALLEFDKLYSQAPLLREDLIAASAYLDLAVIQLEEGKTKDALKSVENAQKYAGFDLAILQNCVFQYLRMITDNDLKKNKDFDRIAAEENAVKCLKILVANDYNLDVNSKILSSIYIKQAQRAATDPVKKIQARDEYNSLFETVSRRSIFPYRHILPWDYEKTLIASYNEVGEKFFQRDEFRYILFKFFDGKIQNHYSDLLNAISGTIQNEDSTPLFNYFERHDAKKVEKEFCAFVWSSFIEFCRKFALNVSYGSDNFISSIGDKSEELSKLLNNLESHSKNGVFSSKPIPLMTEIDEHRKDYKEILETGKEIRKQLSFIAYFAGCFLFDVCQKQQLGPEKKNKKLFDLLDYLEWEVECNRKKIIKVNPGFSYLSLEEFKNYHKKNDPEVKFIEIKKIAEEQKDSAAQYEIGVYYETGHVVQKNLKEAISWYKKASEQGHDGAKDKLLTLAK